MRLVINADHSQHPGERERERERERETLLGDTVRLNSKAVIKRDERRRRRRRFIDCL